MAGSSSPARMPYDQAPGPGGRLAALAAIVVLLSATLIQIYRVGGIEDRRARTFAYTQDAAYQQLVVARELAQGVERGPVHYGGATPLVASASPGWSLALTFLFGMPALSPQSGRGLDELALVPLVVNLAAAALLIAVVGHLASFEVRSAAGMFVFLVALGVLTPVTALVLTGMEHLMHAVFLLLAVAVALRSLDDEDTPIAMTLLAGVLAAVAVALRYESLAALVALVAWAWIQRRVGRSLVWLLAGLGVIVALGVYLRARGGSVWPNPLLVHAGTLLEGGWREWPESIARYAMGNLSAALLPWTLLGMGVVLLASSRARTHSPDESERRRIGWLFVFVFAGLAHLLVGATEPDAVRLTAYLVPFGAVAIARTIGAAYHADRVRLDQPVETGVGPDERAAVIASRSAAGAHRGKGLVALVCVVPLLFLGAARMGYATQAAQASREVYLRNRLAAAFVRTYFPSGPVATDQTGVIGYETNARLVDLSGSTDPEVARARYGGDRSPEAVARQVSRSQAQVVLLFGQGAAVPVPAAWKLVGGWRVAGATARAGSLVRVYAVSPALDADVRIALRLFSEQAHEGVEFWFVQGPAPGHGTPDTAQASGG